jgi:hypothetical protein
MSIIFAILIALNIKWKFLFSISIVVIIISAIVAVCLTEIVTDTPDYESKPVIAIYNILSMICFGCLYFITAYYKSIVWIKIFASVAIVLFVVNLGIIFTDWVNTPIRKGIEKAGEDMGANVIKGGFEDITGDTTSVNGQFTYVPDSISSKLNSNEDYPGCIYMLIMQDYSIIYSKDVLGINDDLSDLQADKFLDNTDIRAIFMLKAADLSYVDSVVPKNMNVYAGGNYSGPSHKGSPDFQVFKAIYFDDINQNSGRLIFFPGDFSIIQYDEIIGLYVYPSNILPYSRSIDRYSANYIYEPTNVALLNLTKSAPSNLVTLTTKSGTTLTITVDLGTKAVTIKNDSHSTVDSYNLVLLA